VFRELRRYVIRKRFQKMVAEFDRQIAEARKAHKPVRPIQKAKSKFVHEKLGMGRA
jgi:hypothetical protein